MSRISIVLGLAHFVAIVGGLVEFVALQRARLRRGPARRA